MVRMGLEDGEVIQHSMITKSIERAKEGRRNHFGTRKRLLEYDDVMNAQREVIYKKRRHALYGERLQLDMLNMQYDLADVIVKNAHDENDYAQLTADCIRYFGMECPITNEEFFGYQECRIAYR
jgi:preprotein translocase subunit SecA